MLPYTPGKDKTDLEKYNSDLGWYESSEKTTVHKLPCKVSCAYCRTPIMDEGRNMILLFPTLINFKSPEDRKNFDPRQAVQCSLQTAQQIAANGFCASCHMFYTRRILDINDGKPKWSGINNESELIEDSPEQDKKRKREEDAAEENGQKS